MIAQNFRERLNELMFDNNFSKQQLADKIGCGSSTVYHYLSGSKMPAVDILIKLADCFNCSVDYLIGLESEYYSQTFLPCPPFCERIPYLCEKYEISRYALQKKTGLSESVLYYWVKGKSQPTIENIIKIAKALNCSVDFVLGRTKE